MVSTVTTQPGDKFKVKLRESGSTRPRQAVFKVTPDLSETRSINYRTIDPIHAPGSILSYVNTASRTYNMSGIKLVSRSSEEAAKNMYLLNLIRSWALPVFGNFTDESGVAARATESGAFSKGNVDILGSPPKVLELSAYSLDSGSTTGTNGVSINKDVGNIYKVPVVMSQYNIQYPSDVDYIPTAELKVPFSTNGQLAVSKGVPFPIIMTIDLNLTETHSPNEYNNFSLSDFRNGRLAGF